LRANQEAYIQGTSTRSVDDLVQAMGMNGISGRQVSRLCEEIDERVRAFRDRLIEGLDRHAIQRPYLWIDATYVKVFQAGRVFSVAVIIAVGINADGWRDVLGLDIGPSEAETVWTAMSIDITCASLCRVACAASSWSSPTGASVPPSPKRCTQPGRRCRVHFMRDDLAHAGRSGGASSPPSSLARPPSHLPLQLRSK
jgi:putative transposase